MKHKKIKSSLQDLVEAEPFIHTYTPVQGAGVLCIAPLGATKSHKVDL